MPKQGFRVRRFASRYYAIGWVDDCSKLEPQNLDGTTWKGLRTSSDGDL